MSKELESKISAVIKEHLSWKDFKKWFHYLNWYDNILDKSEIPSKVVETAEKVKKLRQEHGKTKNTQ